MTKISTILGLVSSLIVGSCAEIESQKPFELHPEFASHWYNGSAELSHFELRQQRYGEVHEGEAVLIYVTEDFRSDKQVKYEGGDRKNVVPILKLNHTKKFFTGIYPYSLMTSIFSPMSGGKSIKVSTSAQEWCGHSFFQFNLTGNRYDGKLFSYFQNEGDVTFKTEDHLLEDQLWTTLRLSPATLATGSIQLIPGTQYLRLNHIDPGAQSATASFTPRTDRRDSDERQMSYTVDYENIDRKLTIHFMEDFPHKITGWEEYGGKNKAMVTTASLTNQIMSPYWSKNGLEDGALRDSLGLRASNY